MRDGGLNSHRPTQDEKCELSFAAYDHLQYVCVCVFLLFVCACVYRAKAPINHTPRTFQYSAHTHTHANTHTVHTHTRGEFIKSQSVISDLSDNSCTPVQTNTHIINTSHTHVGAVTRGAGAQTGPSLFASSSRLQSASPQWNRKASVQGHALPSGIPLNHRELTQLCVTHFIHRTVRETKKGASLNRHFELSQLCCSSTYTSARMCFVFYRDVCRDSYLLRWFYQSRELLGV